MPLALISIIFLILIAGFVNAVTLEGTVYDMSLVKVDSAKVEINTLPVQRDVTEGGKYSFDVRAGSYEITAAYILDGELISSVSEEVIFQKTHKVNILLT